MPIKTLNQNASICAEYSPKKLTTDTGSPESQIAIFSHRIKHLTEHLRTKKKDNSTKLGLIKLVGKRRRLLSYLKQINILRYRNIISSLGLRK